MSKPEQPHACRVSQGSQYFENCLLYMCVQSQPGYMVGAPEPAMPQPPEL